MPCSVARSRTKVRALAIAKRKIERSQFQLHAFSLDLGEIKNLIE
jgi:hypothetical protein